MSENLAFGKAEDRIIFYYCLSVTLRSGLPIDKSLWSLYETAEEKQQQATAAVCHHLYEKIVTGSTVAQSVGSLPKAFPQHTAAIVKAAESTGHLDEIFDMLAGEEDKRLRLKRQLTGALIYPLVVLAVAVVLVLAPALILGDLESVFTQLGVPMPSYLRAILLVSAMFWNPYFVIALGLLGVVLVHQCRKPKTADRFRRLARRYIPGFSYLLILTSNIQFCLLLRMQLKVGCPLLSSLEAALLGTGDPLFIREVEGYRGTKMEQLSIPGRVRNGTPLAEALQRSGLFVQQVSSLVALAEEQGSLVENLDTVASFLQDDLDYRMQIISSLIEPIFIMLTGAFVAAIACGVFIPLLQTLNL